MASRTWLLDTSPTGTNINASNTKADDLTSVGVVDASGTAITSDSAYAHQGGLSVKVANTGVLVAFLTFAVTTPHTIGAVRFYHYMTALPSYNLGSLVELSRADGTPALKVGIQSTGVLWGRDAAAGSLGVSAAALVANQWNRVEITYDLALSGGTANISVYNGDSTTAYLTFNQTAKNFGGVNITYAGIGFPGGAPVASAAWNQWVDVPTLRDAGTTFIGAYVPPAANIAPTANAGADQTVAGGAFVTLTGTGTDSDGTIASGVWTQTGGTTVTLGGSGLVRTFTAPGNPAGETLTFSLIVTDDDGAASTADTMTVTVEAALASPVLTVTSTNPTGVGLTDGAGEGTWTESAGATAYESCIVLGTATSGFVSTRSDATLERIFADLAADTYTIAVRAV